MDYQHLDLYFEWLWGDDILKGKESPLEQKMWEWRDMMAKKPIEERYALSDEEYDRLEDEEREKHILKGLK